MAYASGGSQEPYPGQIPAQDDPWWHDALDWIGGLFSSEYPKPLPPPLPFSVAQVQAMMAAEPYIASGILVEMKRQGHTHLFLGREPTDADWSNAKTRAELALWFANGTGDDLSRGEALIRKLVIQGMQTYAGGSGGVVTDPGGGVSLPGGAVTASLGPLLALAAAGLLISKRKA